MQIESVPSSPEITVVSTEPQSRTRVRTVGYGAAAAGGVLGVGAGVAILTGSRRAGLIAGGVTALAAAAVRWQLHRWFTDEPAYTVERRIGELEIRRYEPRIEAHTRVAEIDFDQALRQGFRRLFGYIARGNDAKQKIAMTSPVLSRPRATTHTVAFVMPPGQTMGELPEPADSTVQLVQIQERRVAALRYHGRYTNERFQEAQARLLDLVSAAKLEFVGEPIFAGFDPPTTLPLLRRSEVWIELQ